MENEKNVFTHIIEIDEFIEVTMKIPEKLNALELKGIMSKANKLFNLAEVPIVSKAYVENKSMHQDERTRNFNFKLFTDEMVTYIVKNYHHKFSYSKITRMLNHKFNKNFSTEQVRTKIGNLKYANKLDYYLHLNPDSSNDEESETNNETEDVEEVQQKPVENAHIKRKYRKTGRPQSIFTDAQINAIIMYRQQGQTYSQIHERINEVFGTDFTSIQIKDKISSLKKGGRL